MLKTVSTSTSAVTGALVYQGTWNASTNTPTLTSGVGTKGYYYVVSVAGSTNLDGITDWGVNDWAVFNGTVWQKVDNSETVYGTMASQNANAVIITGGTINSVTENACTYTNVTISSGNATLTNVNATLTNTANVQVRSLTGYVYANNTANATASLTIPVANVTGAVPNTVYVIAGAGLSGGGALTGNVTLTATNVNSGTVTQVQGNGTVNGITLTGNVTTSGNLTLGGTLGGIANSQLSNSSVTIGNTSVSLGSTITSVGNLTLTNVTISNVATTFPNSFLANSTTTLGNATLTLGSTTTNVGNLTLSNANITSVAATFPNSYLANSSLTIGNTSVSLGGTATSIGNLTLANVTITSGSISNIVVTSNIVTKTSAYTATANDETILGNASTASFVITLPTSVGITGKIYIVKKIDSSANTVTISTTSAQTIDGSASKVISYQYDGYQVQSDGANWFIISSIFGRNGTAGTF